MSLGKLGVMGARFSATLTGGGVLPGVVAVLARKDFVIETGLNDRGFFTEPERATLEASGRLESVSEPGWSGVALSTSLLIVRLRSPWSWEEFGSSGVVSESCGSCSWCWADSGVTADSLSWWDACRSAEGERSSTDWWLISALWGPNSAITVSASERLTVVRSWASCAAR